MRDYDAEIAFFSPKGDTPNVKAIKAAGQHLAEEIIKLTTKSPEQTLALRYAEESVLRAVDSLARQTAAEEVEKERKTKTKVA